ncbi:unnamed protein product [Aureobasidium mustum]|uniref:DUF6594 domain-containing protein n=1 Tax=Aureobasidium mustum TaxID=2773714 RepID=A0A9N8JL27_9PEZI|nr:unnamed protein product [Aureobasidium mustum]
MFTQKPQGYHRLADLMGRYPETAIFRRFSSLNMINLLSLQAELIELRENCEDVWAKDGGLDNIDEEKLSTFLKDSSQYKLLLKLRKKLREYSTAQA